MASPTNLLQLQDAQKSFGSRILFEGATFSINENEHIGVIGPNGAGKTTLFKILADETDLDAGQVVKSRQLRLGYLRQHDTWDENQILEDYLATNTETPIWDLKKWGLDLGLKEEQFSAPIKSLSGGYRMRAKLLHLLGEQPNLMLLDEPTNYLDLETLLVLEEFLQNYQGAFLLISHDREFLRRTTDHILEIESGDFVKFSGNIDDYFDQKELLREQLEKKALSQAAKRKEILDFVTRFGAKASKARQAQSRLKQLGKMEKIELKRLPVSAKIRIPEPRHTGRLSLELKDADLGYGDKVILHQLNFNIESGDRIGVVGLNGAGKSTLLKSISKEIPCISGELEYGYQVSAAFYGQHVSERLDPNDSVLEAMQSVAHPSVRPQEILDLAGSLLFSGDAVKKKVSLLSGGEKARVALGQVLLKKAPLLIMDEPTNHLDFYTVEALTQALETFKGSVVIVSHDRGFIGRVATKILEVSQGQVLLYPASYEEYVWSLQRRRAAGEVLEEKPIKRKSEPQVQAQKPITSSRPKANLSPFQKAQIKELETQKRELEKGLQEIDRKTKSLSSRMIEQSTKLQSAQGDQAEKISKEISLMQKSIDDFEAEFMEKLEAKEKLQAQIDEIKQG